MGYTAFQKEIESNMMHVLPPQCRPQGWIALWRRMAMLSALNKCA
jgi:hypothetical protein